MKHQPRRRRVGQDREESRIQRQNPVPPGRYWLDVVTPAALQRWEAMLDREGKALQVDDFEPLPDPSASYDPPRFTKLGWYLFFVTAPVSWPAGLAPPNTAPSWIKKRSDVQQRPEDYRRHPVRTAQEEVRRTAEEAAQWGQEELVPLLVIGALIWYLASRERA